MVISVEVYVNRRKAEAIRDLCSHYNCFLEEYIDQGESLIRTTIRGLPEDVVRLDAASEEESVIVVTNVPVRSVYGNLCLVCRDYGWDYDHIRKMGLRFMVDDSILVERIAITKQ